MLNYIIVKCIHYVKSPRGVKFGACQKLRRLK